MPLDEQAGHSEETREQCYPGRKWRGVAIPVPEKTQCVLDQTPIHSQKQCRHYSVGEQGTQSICRVTEQGLSSKQHQWECVYAQIDLDVEKQGLKEVLESECVTRARVQPGGARQKNGGRGPEKKL